VPQYKKDQPCIDDCGRLVGPRGAKGRCQACNQRWRRRERKADPLPCSVKDCLGKVVSPGVNVCDMHRSRLRRYGDLGEPQSLIGPRGDGYIRKDGYRVIAGLPEHRIVMEQLLGRRLLRHENVHHVNGQRADNRTDGPLRNWRSGNLELWSNWQPPGQRVADKIGFAVDLLREYAPDLLAETKEMD